MSFENIVGNTKIKQELKNVANSNAVSHSYLFVGEEGIGKKQIAREFAKMILCLSQEKENCNQCDSCIKFISNNNPDFIEISEDGNSIKIAQIRELQEKIYQKPIVSSKKVVIIDNSEKMTEEAQNSLLKTLEEPPSYVIFILATTEPHKIPATILSRCQRFDFKKISDENIDKRLQYICDESKIEITNEALKIIAVLSEGAMRDALSILERCLQEGNNQINEELVKELVGIPKLEYISGITESIINYDVDNALKVVNEVL